MLLPLIAGSLYPIIFTTVLPIMSAGFPQLAKKTTATTIKQVIGMVIWYHRFNTP